MDTHTFTLTDADGEEHTYQAFPMGIDRGEPIMYALAAAGVEPLAVAARSVLGQANGTLEQLLDQDVAQLAVVVDWGEAGASLRRVLSDPQLPGLREQLLRGVIRDGKDLQNPDELNAAYQRNYVEMIRACIEVIRYNRFFPL